MITIICPQCNKEFKTYPYRLKVAKKVYCSISCMAKGYSLPEEIRYSNKLKSNKKWNDEHKKEQKEYRLNNKEKIKKIQADYYINNKSNPHYKEIGKKSYKNRIKKYKTNPVFNLKEVVVASKFACEKMKKNKEWKEKIIEQSHRYSEEKQEMTLENALAYKGSSWTDGEVDYLRNNHTKKTILELAFELRRTFLSVKSALWRYKIGRKVRILKGVYY